MTIRKAKMPATKEKDKKRQKKRTMCLLLTSVSVNTRVFIEKSAVCSVGRDKLTLPLFSALQLLMYHSLRLSLHIRIHTDDGHIY